MDNQTVIDTIVKYSKDCIIMRFIKQHVETSLILTKRLPTPFIARSADTMKIVLSEIELAIDEREMDIGKLIEPLFEGNDFGHKNSKKHSLTIQEIKDGHITLAGEKYVILLRPYKSSISNFTFLPGILYKIGSGILEDDLKLIKRIDNHVIPQDIMNLIINKKRPYEYIE